MLIPRFSLKFLLLLVTIASFSSLVVAAAVRGDAWATGLIIGLLFIPIFFLVNVFLFAIAWVFSFLRSKPKETPLETPPTTMPPSPQG